MWGTYSLLLVPLQPEVVLYFRIQSISQIELFNHLPNLAIFISYMKSYSRVQIIAIRKTYSIHRIAKVK